LVHVHVEIIAISFNVSEVHDDVYGRAVEDADELGLSVVLNLKMHSPKDASVTEREILLKPPTL
jgi:hypothetical protein